MDLTFQLTTYIFEGKNRLTFSDVTCERFTSQVNSLYTLVAGGCVLRLNPLCAQKVTLYFIDKFRVLGNYLIDNERNRYIIKWTKQIHPDYYRKIYLK